MTLQQHFYSGAPDNFLSSFEEVRQWFRSRQRMKQAVSLADKRRLFMERFAALHAIMLAA
jgi:hypothetical protein